ncbi:uncharacterized protein [Chironomus tepperi]|uniref:uncharacterized protein n=1 Tax=Chironomus tepperi TaxID=113505 RepID=UPI00391F55DA
MEPDTISPEDVPHLNIRKAPVLQGQSQKYEGMNGEALIPTVINILKEPRALLVEKEKEEGLKTWMITNCDSLSEALQFFDTKSLKIELNEPSNVLVLRFEVDEDFVDLNLREILDLSNKCLKKSVLILLMCMEAKKFSIFWKSKDIKSLLALKPYKEKLSEDHIELYEFIAEFLTNSLKMGHLGLHNGYSNRNDANKIELHLLADTRGYNLLLLAVESGNAKIAKMLLESGLTPDLPESSSSAQSIAVDSGHFNVLLMLLQSNLTFPSNLDVNKCPADVQQFIEVSKLIRKALKDKDVKKVEEILHTNKNIRHFYSTSNESAPKFAIENNLIDMYEVLLTNKVLFGPDEDVISIMNKLDYDEKRHLREVHFKHSIDMPEKHINTLMANSYVGHEEVTNVQEKLDLVQNAFKLLNENPFIRIILLIVAASKKFRIIFDFNRDSVELIDPTAESYTAGLFYLSGRMYIGAKQLLDQARQNEAIATIAHELCHYAMNLVYNNDANPYKKDDQESHDKIEKVSRECQDKSGTEDIVDMVYECYPKDMHHAELIVRAPHMMAYYHDQPEKLKESKENFNGLFSLYEEKVFPEMEKALPEIEERVEKEMAKKDKEITKLRKRFYLAILIFSILIMGICVVAYIFRKNENEYRNLSSDNQQLIQNHLVQYAGVKVHFKDLLEPNSSVYYNLKHSDVEYLLEHKEPFNIDGKGYDPIDKLNWTILADPLKKKILNSNVTFQSKNLKFKDLHAKYPESFNFISQKEIKQVLFNGSLKVGDMVNSGASFYIQRDFIDENINLAYHKFETENSKNSFKDFYGAFVAKDYDEYRKALQEVEDSNSYKSNSRKSTLKTNKLDFAHFNFDRIIEKAEKDKVFILSDEAGSGKTVTFENLAKYIKSKKPLYWISFIDLKRFALKYKEDAEPIDLLRSYVAQTEFENVLFDMAFESKRIFILWNGFDEISSGFYDEIINLFKFFYESNIIQFVCTRPTFSLDLRNLFKQISFKLVPFNETVRKEFIISYIKSKNSSINVMERTNQTIEQIKVLESKSGSSDFNTPLILIMIVDIGDNTNAIESGNLYSIYDSFIHKKIEIWKKKTNSSDEFITKVISGKENLIKVFQFYALYNELTNFDTITLLNIIELEDFKARYLSEITGESEIARLGILHYDGYGNLKLSHKSFIEFLVAQYLIENIYSFDNCAGKDEARTRLELFFYFTRVYGHNQWLITDFMKDYLVLQNKIKENQKLQESSNDNHNKKNAFKKKVYKSSNENFNTEISRSIEKNFPRAFINLLSTDQPQIFKFLFDFFKKDSKILKIFLQFDEPETLYTAAFNPIYNAYHIDPNMILELVDKTNVLNEEEYKRFINGDNQKGTILLGMFYYRNEKIQKVHKNYENVNFTSDSTLCDLFDMLNSSLTDIQWTDLLTSDAGSIIIPNYLYKEEIQSLISCPSNDFSFADSFELVLDNLVDNDKETCFELSLTHYLEISSSHSYPPDEKQLKYLLNNFGMTFEPERILAMINNRHMLHKAALKFENFKILWEFYIENCKNSTEDEDLTNSEIIKDIRKVLLDKDNGTFYYDNFNLEKTSSDTNISYNSRYFDLHPQTIFYRGITNSKNISTFNYFTRIYKDYLTDNQLMKTLTESLHDIFYFISFAKLDICKEFALFLKETFTNDVERLNNTLNEEFSKGLAIHDIFNDVVKNRLECSKKIHEVPDEIKKSKEKEKEIRGHYSYGLYGIRGRISKTSILALTGY